MARGTSPHLQKLLDRQNELTGYDAFVKSLPAARTPETRINQADPMRLQLKVNQNTNQRDERMLQEFQQHVRFRTGYHLERGQRVRG